MASRLAAILALALSAGCHGSAIAPRDESTTPGQFLRCPVMHSTNAIFADVWAKRGIQTVPLANRSDVAYYARLDIGNPAQPNFVQLDTGSFELWVNPDCSKLSAAADVRFCQAVGSYKPSNSSTAVVTQSTKSLRYGIGSANIQYVVDDIAFAGAGAKLKSVQFGSATSTVDEWSGILGIGHGENVTIRYKNFVDELQDQGVTATKAFSLALGGKSEKEGVIIFGGIDTGKFTGTLQTQPIIPAASSPDGVPRYWISMDYMSLTPPSGNVKKYSNSTMAVFLDSGATLTLLPKTLADSIAADFGASAADADGFYRVDCSLNDLPGTVDFAFNGVTIRVPYDEMIRELRTGFGTECYLGISPNSDFVLLGDTMLRSAYAVFDQTNNAIHLAQYTNCGTSEQEITTSTVMSQIQGQCGSPNFKAAPSATPSTTPSGFAAGSSGAARSGSSTTRPTPGGVSLGWLSLWVGSMLAAGLMGVI